MSEELYELEHDFMVVVFFDVDNTMMVGVLIFYFACGLASWDFFLWCDLMRFIMWQVWLRLKGEIRGDMHSVWDFALAFVVGKKVDEIIAFGEEIYDEEMADRIWSGMYAMV